MNNLTLIGIVGRDAHVAYFKPEVHAAVTTFWIATKAPCSSINSRDAITTWHKITAYGRLQEFAATIEKGDLVAVSGPINTQSFEGKNGKVETYSVRANSLDMLKRKNARSSDAPIEAAAELTEDAPF